MYGFSRSIGILHVVHYVMVLNDPEGKGDRQNLICSVAKLNLEENLRWDHG